MGAFIAIASAAALSSAATHDVAISLATNDDGRRVFEVRSDHKTLAPVEDQLKRSFAVYVVFDSAPADPPPLAGDYSVVDGAIRFKPRFPLEPGMRYKAVFRSGGRKLTQEFVIPARAAAPAARVRAIYPTARVLPQNQLKFYLQFTAPMGRGDAYRHLTLLDAKGEAVDLPFLELSEELWNPRGDRLTLLLDPARVKNDLKPREESGPVLETGRSYTLLVRRDLRDAAGRPLADDFRKEFTVGQPDETCPQPKLWRLQAPHAQTDEPFIVHFGEPLD
ncbi:MAG: hypothetical protein ACREHD_00545, partial [Pirellulales bacterium]